jgi:uncharacterized protein (DUF305 family)
MAVVAAFATMAAVTTGGCSSSPDAPSAADGAFVQDMASSASAAMFMADQARTRSTDPAIRELGNDVFEEVTPIVDQLTELGPALAADGADGFAHEDEESHDAASANRVDDLRAAPAKKFDDMFLKLLSQELRTGKDMALTAQGSVTDPRSRAVADESFKVWSTLINQVDTTKP